MEEDNFNFLYYPVIDTTPTESSFVSFPELDTVKYVLVFQKPNGSYNLEGFTGTLLDPWYVKEACTENKLKGNKFIGWEYGTINVLSERYPTK